MDVRPAIVLAETAFELVGVSVLIVGSSIALVRCAVALLRGQSLSDAYRSLRQGVARAILLGLEFLVAADIVRSVALDPTFESVGVLGLLVVIRTFLSWTLEVEITGEWPWQRNEPAAGAAGTTREL